MELFMFCEAIQSILTGQSLSYHRAKGHDKPVDDVTRGWVWVDA